MARCDRLAVLSLMMVFLQIIRAPALKTDCPIRLCGSSTEARWEWERRPGAALPAARSWPMTALPWQHPWCLPNSAGKSLSSATISLASNKPIIWGKLIIARTGAMPAANHISNTANAQRCFFLCWLGAAAYLHSAENRLDCTSASTIYGNISLPFKTISCFSAISVKQQIWTLLTPCLTRCL